MRLVSALLSIALVTSSAAPTGSLSGRVLDVHRQPVPQVRVLALDAKSHLPVSSARTTIDENGVFHVTGLAAGRYLLRTQISPFNMSVPLPGIAANARTFSRAAFDRTAPFVTSEDGAFAQFGAPAFIDDGQTFQYVPSYFGGATSAPDASIISLGSDESKAGLDITVPTRQTVTVRGTVSGPDGPVDDAWITLDSDTIDGLLLSAASGPGGKFEFVNAPRVLMRLTVRRRDPVAAVILSAEGFPLYFNDDASRSGEPTSREVEGRVSAIATSEVVVNFQLGPQAAKVWKPESGRPAEPPAARPSGTASLEGDVIDDAGSAVTRASVVIVAAALGGPRATITDQRGHFALHRLVGAQVRLFVTPPSGPTTESGESGVGTVGRPITINPTGTTRVTVHVFARRPTG